MIVYVCACVLIYALISGRIFGLERMVLHGQRCELAEQHFCSSYRFNGTSYGMYNIHDRCLVRHLHVCLGRIELSTAIWTTRIYFGVFSDEIIRKIRNKK